MEDICREYKATLKGICNVSKLNIYSYLFRKTKSKINVSTSILIELKLRTG